MLPPAPAWVNDDAAEAAQPGKFTHAEMSPVLVGIRGKQLPEAVMICNFPAPRASDSGLKGYEDVQTFFHELEDLMHWILGGQQAGRVHSTAAFEHWVGEEFQDSSPSAK